MQERKKNPNERCNFNVAMVLVIQLQLHFCTIYVRQDILDLLGCTFIYFFANRAKFYTKNKIDNVCQSKQLFKVIDNCPGGCARHNNFLLFFLSYFLCYFNITCRIKKIVFLNYELTLKPFHKILKRLREFAFFFSFCNSYD